MSDEERLALLQLKLLPGIGDRRLTRLLQMTGSALEALAGGRPSVQKLIGERAATTLRDPAVKGKAAALLDRCDALGIGIVAVVGSSLYPSRLAHLSDPPPVLFLRGDPSLLSSPCVAIVGSRRATGAGRRTAGRISRGLSDARVCVVSGLALGIDGAAHRGALAAEGRTIAVLGCGPDRAYPAGNRRLFEEILERGLIVSEFPPDDPPRPHHFPRRNRIIAGLSAGVVVVEATRRSGALITVDHAIDLGLDVLAVPGSVESGNAEGTNALIRDGAHLVTSSRDVLEILGIGAPPKGSDAPRGESNGGTPAPPAEADEARVEAAFGLAPMSLDRLVPAVGIPVERILAALTRLELRGSVDRTGEGWTLSRSVP
jgi:DNA processing protein